MNRYFARTLHSLWLVCLISPLAANLTRARPPLPAPGPGLLQTWIDAAADGATLAIPAGIYHENVIIRKSLTLRGTNAANTVVDGQGLGCVFVVHPDLQVTLDGLTMVNGFHQGADGTSDTPAGTGFGGGVQNHGSTLTLLNCTLSNNVAQGGHGAYGNRGGDALGGGIWQEGGSLILSNCLLTDNRVTSGAGFVPLFGGMGAEDGQARGGGIASVEGAVTLDQCDVRHNQALGVSRGTGGGAYGGGLWQDGGSAHLMRTRWATNLAIGGYAGWEEVQGRYRPEPEDGWGGAIGNTGEATVTDCTFLGNASVGGTADIASARTRGCGGAILNLGRASVFASVFLGNAALGGEGLKDWNSGAIAPGGPGCGGAICNLSNLVVSRCTFATNLARGGPGNARSPTYGNDRGAGRGGALYTAGSCVVAESEFVENTAAGGAGSPRVAQADGDAGEGEGGGIFSAGQLVTERNTFARNRARGGNAPLSSAPDPYGQAGTARGGGLLALGLADATNNTFHANAAAGGEGRTEFPGGDGLGGGVFGPARLSHCTLAANRADGGVGTNGLAGNGRGGGACTTTGWLTLNNSILADSPSGGNAAGAILDAGYNLSSDASVALTNASSRTLTDPMLGPLALQGGPTRTMALLPGSPAIDAGSASEGPAFDQRGIARPHEVAGILNAADGTDIGAFEYAGSSWCQYTLSSTQAEFEAAGGSGTLTVTVNDPRGEWAVAIPNAWLVILGPTLGVGSGSIQYLLEPNCGPARTGTLTIAGQSLRVTQAGDPAPPHILCPPDLVVASADGSSANVVFSVTASNQCAVLPVTCMPPSGSTFPLGTTPVACTVSDAVGQTNACAFLVTVQSPNAPPICEPRFPGTWTDTNAIHAITLDGAAACLVLDGSASHDPETNALQFTWITDETNVLHGSLATGCLAAGCHRVVLLVSDGLAESRCERQVCVRTADEAVEQCIAAVEASELTRKTKRPLIATLKAAVGSCARGNLTSGVNQLRAFQAKVRSQVGRANPAQAAAFIQSAQNVLDAIAVATAHPGVGEAR